MHPGHKKFNKLLFLILPFTLLVAILTVLVSQGNVQLLNPKGIISVRQSQLMVTFVLLMLTIVIPVLFLTFFVAWKYQSGNKAKYSPNAVHNFRNELVLWAIPTVIVVILAVITWNRTHELDPIKPLDSTVKPLTIEVVALQWKWLFIYPEQNIATVNFIQFPEQTPVNFQLTADAPMNSFWIPQLGGQMYAMPGMSTKLHLMANESGDFAGSAAELSGSGFAGMKFIARASSQADFNAWVQSVKMSPHTLNMPEYEKIMKPSENSPVISYASAETNLYGKIMMKFMPMSGMDQTMPDMPGMEHYH